MFHMGKSRTIHYSKAHLLFRLANDYEEILSVLRNFGPLNCSKGPEFQEAAFNPVETITAF